MQWYLQGGYIYHLNSPWAALAPASVSSCTDQDDNQDLHPTMVSTESSPSIVLGMKPLSRWRKLFGLGSPFRPNTAPGRLSSYSEDGLDSGRKVPSGSILDEVPTLDVRNDAPRSRRLHHSSSSPALRKQANGRLSPPTNDAKTPFLIISILGDSEAALARKRSKSAQPKTTLSEYTHKALSISDSRSSLAREKNANSKNTDHRNPLQTIPSNEAVDPVSSLSSTAFMSIYSQDRALASSTSIDSVASLDTQLGKENFRRRRSINKITRTLGGCPPEYSRTYFAGCPPSPAFSEPCFSLAQLSPPLPPPTRGAQVKKTKRKSLTLSNLGNLPTIFRSSSESMARFTRSSSRASLSTANTDDLHKLHDGLSEGWGEMRDDSHGGMHTPISPILFNPPSPLPGPPKKAPWSEATTVFPISDTTEPPRTPPPSLASPPAPSSQRHSLIGRSRSQSYAPTRSSQLFLPRSRTPFDHDPSLPVKAYWLDEAPRNSQQGQGPTDQPPPTSRREDWTGEWNQSDMLDVIKALRQLK